MDVTKVGKFNNLKTAAIDKLQGFGLTKNNFVLFWQDDAKSYNIVKDDEDLDLALEELKTPLVELIASPKETEPKGKYDDVVCLQHLVRKFLNGIFLKNDA